MDHVLGFLLGIVGSVLVWWVFAHLLVPRIEFEAMILLRPTHDTGIPRYMVKVTNTGRRDLVDVLMIAITSIQTLLGSDLHRAHCRLAFHRTGATEHHMPIIRPGKHRLVTLYPSHSEQICYETSLSESIRQAARDRCLDLPTLLGDGAASGRKITLQIFVFGYDRFSGARKLFESKHYELTDVEGQKAEPANSPS